MLATREVLGVKLETTYADGTTVPTAAADAVLVEDLNISFADARMHERNPVKPSFGALGDLYAGALMEVSGKVEIKASGVAGTAPEADPIYQMCGLKHTNVPVTSDTYDLASTGHKSAALYVWEDGLLYKLTGCRGLGKAMWEIGKPGIFEFSGKAHFAGPVDEALPAPTFDAIAPVVAHGMAFAVDGFSPNISAFNVDLGGSLAVPDDITAADGFGEVRIVGPRRVTGGFDPLATLVATYDWVAKWQANGPGASLTTGVVGAVAGNRYQVTLPDVQYREIGRGDNAGVRKREIGFLARETAGDDEFTLAFT